MEIGLGEVSVNDLAKRPVLINLCPLRPLGRRLTLKHGPSSLSKELLQFNRLSRLAFLKGAQPQVSDECSAVVTLDLKRIVPERCGVVSNRCAVGGVTGLLE